MDLACGKIRLRNESGDLKLSPSWNAVLHRLNETSKATPGRATIRPRLSSTDRPDLAGAAECDGKPVKWREIELRETVSAVAAAEAELGEAEARGDVARAAEIRYGSLKYLQIARTDLEQKVAAAGGGTDEVLPEHIAEVIAERASIPVQRMLGKASATPAHAA